MRPDLLVTDVSNYLEQCLAHTETQAGDRGEGFYFCGKCEFCGEKKTTREDGILQYHKKEEGEDLKKHSFGRV